MLASCGAPVVTLHRLSMGALSLPEDLLPGRWRPLTEAEVNTLRRNVDCDLFDRTTKKAIRFLWKRKNACKIVIMTV